MMAGGTSKAGLLFPFIGFLVPVVLGFFFGLVPLTSTAPGLLSKVSSTTS